MNFRAGAIAAAGLIASTALADEGQWPVSRLGDIDRARIESLGFRLPLSDLYNDRGGLMRAAVNLSGCSAAFVSTDGLIATNYHCAYRAVQASSTPEQDRLATGFLARERKQELVAKGYTVLVLRSIRDVTSDIRKVETGAKDDLARERAIDRRKKEIVASCEKKAPALRCAVATFSLGERYELHESLELSDIRVVYAPPSSVGEYGGEIDNWMWPRHTGDFALLRAYADPKGKPAEYADSNVAYHPAEWLKVSAGGVTPGDFVAVLGYPGRTERYLRALEVQRQIEQVLPKTVELMTEWVGVLEEQSKRDKAVAIKVAAQKKSFANHAKNSRGMLDGLARLSLLERRKKEEQRMALWLEAPGREAQRKAVAELDSMVADRKQSFERDLLLSNVVRGPNLLGVAIDLVRRQKESGKPDLERDEPYMDRNAIRLWKSIERRLHDADPEVDAKLLESLTVRAKGLPKGQEIPALGRVQFRGSSLAKLELAKKLFDTPAEVEKSRDSVIVAARSLVLEIEAMEQEGRTRDGRAARIAPLYFEAVRAIRKTPFYPDANGTLRLSYATVTGYSPRDGLEAKPQTTLLGAVQKHTGQEPFDLPKAVRDKAATAKESYWSDPILGDVPTCFLSNADTTGGNSGSPVIDASGHLVGLNFDRVWENIAGDYAWGSARSRNISVDIRYLLWLLDRVDDAEPLLQELGVAGFRSLPARRGREEPVAPTPVPSAVTTPTAKSCGCRIGERDDVGWRSILGAILLFGVIQRRGGARRGARATRRCDRDRSVPRDDDARARTRVRSATEEEDAEPSA